MFESVIVVCGVLQKLCVGGCYVVKKEYGAL